MTNHETAYVPPSARQLLHDHGLPEDVIDGVLCLHAQELAAVQRRDAAVWGVDTAAGKHRLGAADLIDPTRAAAAAVSVPPPAPRAADRRARYAAAIAEGFRAFDADTTSDAYLDAELLDAVVAVADAEEAELLAAVSVVPPAPRAPGLRAAAAEADRAGGLYAARGDEARAGAAFSLMETLTAMADCPSCDAGIEHDVHCPTPETHNAGCGCDTDLDALGPCVAGEQQNETPEGKPGCAHCGGDHSWDDCEAYTALVAQDGPPSPLRRSEDDCPGFPERCPNLRPVDPNPPTHYGGIRCGCADAEPRP